MKKIFFLPLLLVSCIGINAQSNIDTNTVRTIIVFFDGLRTDYITPELMPNLHQFKLENAYGDAHHSVFPTVTRVNAISYATGSYPATHGVMGNNIHIPELKNTKIYNTGDATDLNEIQNLTNGNLVTAKSLGEELKKNGKGMMVFSSGSTGQAYMQNHTLCGPILNTEMILPDSIKENILKELGEIPKATKPVNVRHKWITDALIKYGIDKNVSLVNAIWYSDPDGVAHADGIGAPTTNTSIKYVDEQFGRIINYLKEKGLTQKFNIIISTDHGFVTYIGKQSLTDFLIEKKFKESKSSDDIIVAGGALFVKNHDRGKIEKIVNALQQENWVGGIFTKPIKPNSDLGVIPGTLSYETIHWNHQTRAADILVDMNWNDEKNINGYAGCSFSKGVAGHGSLSPYEVRIPLIVSGPAFKKKFISTIPTSNVDITPTILSFYKIPLPKNMDGRVMNELLLSSKQKPLPVQKKLIKSTTSNNKYNISLYQTTYGNYNYVDYVEVNRQ